jgi:hypothetical protein
METKQFPSAQAFTFLPPLTTNLGLGQSSASKRAEEEEISSRVRVSIGITPHTGTLQREWIVRPDSHFPGFPGELTTGHQQPLRLVAIAALTPRERHEKRHDTAAVK